MPLDRHDPQPGGHNRMTCAIYQLAIGSRRGCNRCGSRFFSKLLGVSGGVPEQSDGKEMLYVAAKDVPGSDPRLNVLH